MYPPPGACRYPLPKPGHRNNIYTVREELCANGCGYCWSWWRAMPIFKSCFWNMIIMITLIITTGHFSTIIMFPHIHESLFVIYSKSTKKVPAVSPFDWQSHHRKVNNLMVFNASHTRVSINESLVTAFTYSSESLINSRNKSVKTYNETDRSGLLHILENSDVGYTPHLLSSSVGSRVNYEKNPSVISNIRTNSTERKLQQLGSREKKEPEENGIDAHLKLCPPIPPNLEGHFKVVVNNIPPLEVQEKASINLFPGGRFRPSECQARNKVAIIIPFRDRATHLAVFLYNIHPMLQKQQLDYAIFIVEQAGYGKFNRAMLMNVGSIEALKLYPYDCFIFHDVDLIPEDDRNLYTCPEQPRHMSVAINTFKYRLPYNDIFGGVSALTVEQLKTVNGFSNRFWGWGGEDDDMSNRIKYHGFYISRYPANIARYTMISHKKDRPNPQRFKVLNEGKKRFDKDGLRNVKYKVLDIQLKALYTWVNVELFKV